MSAATETCTGEELIKGGVSDEMCHSQTENLYEWYDSRGKNLSEKLTFPL